MAEWWSQMKTKLVMQRIQKHANVFHLTTKYSGVRATSYFSERVVSGADSKGFDLKPEEETTASLDTPPSPLQTNDWPFSTPEFKAFHSGDVEQEDSWGQQIKLKAASKRGPKDLIETCGCDITGNSCLHFLAEYWRVLLHGNENMPITNVTY